MNDFAMARSNEMASQRRPDSREYRGAPGSMPAPGQISPRGAPHRDGPSPHHIRQVVVGPSGSSADPRARADPRYVTTQDGHRLITTGAPDHRGDPRATLHDLGRGDPRLSDPRGDPRADIALSREPHRGDPRADLRMAPGHPEVIRRSDGRVVIDRGDPRLVVDHRGAQAIDPRTGAALADPHPRVEIDRRSTTGASGAYGYPAQVYLSSDGRLQSRAQASAARTPPPISIASLVQVPSTVSMRAPGGLTTGKPIVTKPSGSMAPPQMATGHTVHREVEIYRTHPEVTISKTNIPRTAGGDRLADLANLAIQQPKLPDLRVEPRGGPIPGTSQASLPGASIHYQGPPGGGNPRGVPAHFASAGGSSDPARRYPDTVIDVVDKAGVGRASTSQVLDCSNISSRLKLISPIM